MVCREEGGEAGKQAQDGSSRLQGVGSIPGRLIKQALGAEGRWMECGGGPAGKAFAVSRN